MAVSGEDYEFDRHLLFSIRPEYADKIVRGEKTVELRRRFSVATPPGTTAFIYSTSPTKAVIGAARIEDVYGLPLTELWKQFGELACVEKRYFHEYFEGVDKGFAIVLHRVHKFSRKINISELRDKYGMSPPQSYRFIDGQARLTLWNDGGQIPD